MSKTNRMVLVTAACVLVLAGAALAVDVSVTTGGTVTADGGAPVTARGVCWGLAVNPTIAGQHTSDGAGTGVYVSTITGLLPGTLYHFRAYATNSMGTAYGQDIAFTTQIPVVLPTVTTSPVTNVLRTSAVLGGTAKGDLITAKGVCWGLKRNPTITPSSFTNEGPGEGVFTMLVRKLQRGTRYHVRAYARNIAGISYGKNKTFKTKQADSQET